MVVLFWVLWFFKLICDEVMLIFMVEMEEVVSLMFFDGVCMIFGGFEMIVDVWMM